MKRRKFCCTCSKSPRSGSSVNVSVPALRSSRSFDAEARKRLRKGPPAYPYAVCQPFMSVTENLISRASASRSPLWRTSSKRSPISDIPCSATAVVASGPRIVSTIAA